MGFQAILPVAGPADLYDGGLPPGAILVVDVGRKVNDLWPGGS